MSLGVHSAGAPHEGAPGPGSPLQALDGSAIRSGAGQRAQRAGKQHALRPAPRHGAGTAPLSRALRPALVVHAAPQGRALRPARRQGAPSASHRALRPAPQHTRGSHHGERQRLAPYDMSSLGNTLVWSMREHVLNYFFCVNLPVASGLVPARAPCHGHAPRA